MVTYKHIRQLRPLLDKVLNEGMDWKDFRKELKKATKKCERCGNYDLRLLLVHHVTPRSEGGDDRIENLQILCYNCHRMVHMSHSGRGNRTVNDMVNTVEAYIVAGLNKAKDEPDTDEYDTKDDYRVGGNITKYISSGNDMLEVDNYMVKWCHVCDINRMHDIVELESEVYFGKPHRVKYYVCRMCGVGTKKIRVLNVDEGEQT